MEILIHMCHIILLILTNNIPVWVMLLTKILFIIKYVLCELTVNCHLKSKTSLYLIHDRETILPANPATVT